MGRAPLPELDGAWILPGQAGYDTARSVWNAMVDNRPRMIAHCASERDVVAAVITAREFDLQIGVRCGGHSALGHAVPEDGLLIDLTALARVRIDPARRIALVEGGALLGALDRASQRFGLATTAGNVSHTGVGGLTLGGGMGWLARAHGLACDNVLSFRVVLADGRVVRASSDENEELYWGLRGGGGNFGIVTEFEFRLHHVGTRATTVEYDFAPGHASSAFKTWRDLSLTVPRQATFTAAVSAERLTLGFVWVGPEEPGALLPEFKSLARSTGSRTAPTSYLALQTRDDVGGGHAFRRYSKGHYLRELSDDAIDAILAIDRQFAPAAGLQAYGGAIADVADEATAFSHREVTFEFGAGAAWIDSGEDTERIAASREYAATIKPYASGAYVNALGDDDITRAYSASKLRRLSRVKREWDPENVFRLNHNITPQ